jgi:hypothetical protein
MTYKEIYPFAMKDYRLNEETHKYDYVRIDFANKPSIYGYFFNPQKNLINPEDNTWEFMQFPIETPSNSTPCTVNGEEMISIEFFSRYR